MSIMDGQVSIFDQDTWCGKMSVAHCQAVNQKEMTSDVCWKSWRGSSKKESQFLDLRMASGVTQESSLARDIQLLGQYQMPSIGEFLNVEEGLHSLLTSQDTMHLALFLAKANTTEAPCEVVPSHLSEILEENPDPKYNLSGKACLGILTRASRRGKQLPPMLEEALIQTVVGETDYGQKGIADTIKILREMRCEIGEEALKEWVQRTFVLVQQEEVLLGEVCEPCEDTEDSNECIVVEETGEPGNREDSVCDMRCNGEVGTASQGQEPNEQLRGELDLLMQKLPHENAQKAVIVYCLRIACEGEATLPETLSTVPQWEGTRCYDIGEARLRTPSEYKDVSPTLSARCGTGGNNTPAVIQPTAYTMQDREGCAGGGKGALIQEDRSAALRTVNSQYLFQPVPFSKSRRAQSDTDFETWTESDTANTLNAFDTGDVRTTEAVVYCVDQGGGKSACDVREGKSPTLTTTHDGAPVIALDRASFNQGKNAQYDFEISDKGINSPLVAKGPGAVCYSFNPTSSRDAGDYILDGVANPLINGSCPGHKNAVCYWDGGQVTGTLTANNASGSQRMPDKENFNCVITRYIVRRLTPMECERLQGYPDGWTDIGEYIDSTGKKRQTSDAQRYKCLGNSIALPPWKWILKRISACYERDATMASLFDGIGGFPYLWEQLNGKGTCLWASEIEEFPMAVTKVRIG